MRKAERNSKIWLITVGNEKGEKILQPLWNDLKVTWVKFKLSVFMSRFKIERNEEGGIAIISMKTSYLKWDELGRVFVWDSSPTFFEEGKDVVFVSA